jgi:hypothetical protein
MTRYLFILMTMLPLTAAAAPSLVPFDAVYSVRISAARGEMTMNLTAGHDGLTASSSLRPRGFAKLFASGRVDESTTFAVEEGRVVPLDYAMTDTLGRHDKMAQMTFDRQAKRAAGTDEDGPFEHPIDSDTYDRASIQYALMLDLLNGRRSDSYTMLDGDRRKQLGITYTDDIVADVPLGEYPVTVVQHRTEGSSRRTVLYCAPALGYLPVRIEQYKNDKLNVRAELTAYTPR